MAHRARGAGRTLGIALMGALLLATVSAGAGVAASPRIDAHCQVLNLDQDDTSISLTEAVSQASPGDRLVLAGRCTGTAIVDKSLYIGGRRIKSSAMVCDRKGCRVTGGSDSGPPTIKGASGLPALVIDPSVRRFRVADGVTVRGGLVVGDATEWGPSGPAAEAWQRWSPNRRLLVRASKPRACRVRNVESRTAFGRLQRAIRKASPADRLLLQGSCKGTTFIGKDLAIHGVRKSRTGQQDPGAPTIKDGGSAPAVIVAAEVSDLRLKRVIIKDGLSVGDTAAYRRFVAGR